MTNAKEVNKNDPTVSVFNSVSYSNNSTLQITITFFGKKSIKQLGNIRGCAIAEIN